MSKAQSQWQKVFKFAVSVANEKRHKNSRLTYPKAMQLAWKDSKVLAMKKEYEKKKSATVKKAPVRKTVKKTVTKKRVVKK